MDYSFLRLLEGLHLQVGRPSNTGIAKTDSASIWYFDCYYFSLNMKQILPVPHAITEKINRGYK